jgi:hypothetical protein
MMMWAAPDTPRLVDPVMCRAVYYVAPSYQVVASANHACEWSAMQRSTIAACLHILQVMITSPACASYRLLGTRECSSVMCEPCSLAVTVKYFFIHPPQIVVGHVTAPEPSRVGRRVRSYGTCGSTGALSSREMGSRAVGRVTALEPSCTGRRGLEPRGAWWH